MQQSFDQISFLVGSAEVLARMSTVPVLPLFSNNALAFLDCLSHRLLHDAEAKQYPDVIAYAFWIRRASMEKAAEQYRTADQRMGRGMAFHVAPSNIPVQFAVSMTYALISGNASVVRISNKRFEQVDILCAAIRDVIQQGHAEMKAYLCVVRYDHDDSITQALSNLCDIRMIWGGNHTVSEIRKASVRPRCIDLGFADRYSIAIIYADDYLKMNIPHIASDFYNDTYFSDQNACSSPRMIVWLGEKVQEARVRFWDELAKIVAEKYSMDPICSSEKLLKTAICAARHPGIREIRDDTTLVRIELPQIYDDIMEFKGNCGYFFEYHANDLKDLIPLFKLECQTITYAGGVDRPLRELIRTMGVRGIDRIVPIGRGADISFVWDGIDLPKALSREIGNT